MLELDHLAVAGDTLAAATSHAEQALGVSLQVGGQHAVFNTHNTLLGLSDGLYLEAIAIDPDAPKPDRARWFDLDRFSGSPRLTNWICRTDDLDAALARLPGGFGTPVDLQRGDLRWRMAVPQSGILPFDNCAPALIQWQSGGHPANRLQPSNLTLTHLQISHPDSDTLREMLGPVLQDDRITYATGGAEISARFTGADGDYGLR